MADDVREDLIEAARGNPPAKLVAAVSQSLPDHPTDFEIQNFPALPDTLVPVDQESGEDNSILAEALRSYQGREKRDDISALVAFAEANRKSRWTPSLLFNLGILNYRNGYFSRALDSWESAWDISKTLESRNGKLIADQAVAEYAKMLARVGRMEELEAILESVGDRELNITAQQRMSQAFEGLWRMKETPETSFLCGPLALGAVARHEGKVPDGALATAIDSIQSTSTGFSIAELGEMSREFDLDFVAMRKTRDAAIVIPSVVHWKIGHFAAILQRDANLYQVIDPTFGNETWMTREAIEAEASGVFLIPERTIPPGWKSIPAEEATALRGRGAVGLSDEDETGECDHKSGGDGCGGAGMASYTFHSLLCSLSVSDMPIPSTPSAGPKIDYRITYNQREADPVTNPQFTNFSAQWVSSFVSYLEEINPGNSKTSISLRKRNGGGETYDNFIESQLRYPAHVNSRATLTRIVDAQGQTTGYVKKYPDLLEEHYGHLIDDRRYFLSKIVDRNGNELDFVYENQINPGSGLKGRLVRVYVQEGFYSELFYENASYPFLVTRIRDPWGRSATLSYDGLGRLEEIEDAAGISSIFGYHSSGLLNSLTTPYGQTTFESGNPVTINGLIRWVQATDPLGATERIEMNLSETTTGMPHFYQGAVPGPGSGISVEPNMSNVDNTTYYWNWKQWEIARHLTGIEKYGKAHLHRWTKINSNTSHGTATGSLVWEQRPLESRIWYNYPFQDWFTPWISGAFKTPSRVARFLDDGSLQLSRFEYNESKMLTSAIDPELQETRFEYFPNKIDLRYVKKKLAGVLVLVAEFGDYQSNGKPGWAKDAAGEQTFFTYTFDGLLETVTNPLAEITTYLYGTSAGTVDYRRLIEVNRTNGAGTATLGTILRDVVSVGGGLTLRVTTTDADGLPTIREYDELMRPTLTTYADGSDEVIKYFRLDPSHLRDRNGKWSSYFYNARRQLAASRDPEGRWIRQTWCECGALMATVDGEGNRTEWQHDLQVRPIKKIFPDQSEVNYVYEQSRSLLDTVTDALGQVKDYDYYKNDQIKRVSYSGALQSTPQVDFTYDSIGRPKTRVDDGGTPSAQTIVHDYHPIALGQLGAGRLSSVTDPWTGTTTTYSYDELGRLTGNISAGSAESWSFDSLGRIESTTNALGTFGAIYVGNGDRVDRISYPGNLGLRYDYLGANHNNRTSGVTFGLRDGSGDIVTQIAAHDYEYDPTGNITKWTQEQSAANAGWDYDFVYDSTSQLKSFQGAALSTGYVDQSQFFGYDDAGNRTSIQSGNQVNREGVNNLNQLLNTGGGGALRVFGSLDEPAVVKVEGRQARMFSDTTFEGEIQAVPGSNTFQVTAEDGSGNLTSRQYEVSVLGASEVSRQYDAVGNLTHDGTRSYGWDAENRLVAIDYGSGRLTTMKYDGLGRRIRIHEKDGAVTLSDKRFLWSGMAIRQEFDWSNTVQKRFFPQGVQIAGVNRFYFRDHLGSPRVITDASGIVLARIDYDAWGQRTLSGSLSPDIGYTGHLWHDPSGLVLAPYRAYDPSVGRWLSRDPLGESAGTNLYSYVSNNPINLWDPLGLDAEFFIHREGGRNSAGTFSAFENGVCKVSTPVNENGYQDGTNGIYPGNYSVQPRTDAIEGKSRFGNGTPAVTAPGETNPGNAGSGYRWVFIHAKGQDGSPDSRGCPTVSSDAAKTIKEIMDRNPGDTSLQIFNNGGGRPAAPVAR